MNDPRYIYTKEGERVLVGKYSEAIRANYIAYRKGRYLIDHPEATVSEASRAARLAWRRKVLAAERVQV